MKRRRRRRRRARKRRQAQTLRDTADVGGEAIIGDRQ